MSFETIVQPISKSENHERVLKERILSLQLEYVQRVFEKNIPPLMEEDTGLDFNSLLETYTDISGIIISAYMQRTYKDVTEDNEEYQIFQKNIFSSLYLLRMADPKHWTERIQEVITEIAEKLPEAKTIEKISSFFIREDRDDQVGLIRYNTISHIEELVQYGFQSDDSYLGIHIEPIYKQKKQEKVENIFSSNTMSKLAEKIVKDFPDIKAVVANSWILDTAIGKRLGFHMYEDSWKNFYHGDTFWGQFFDQDGQIKQNEVKVFLETGKSPFQVKSGFIPRDEFLKKYLPKE